MKMTQVKPITMKIPFMVYSKLSALDNPMIIFGHAQETMVITEYKNQKYRHSAQFA
jgi:hypothetical protein